MKRERNVSKERETRTAFCTLTGVGLNGCSRQACTLTLAIVMLAHNTLAGAGRVIGIILINILCIFGGIHLPVRRNSGVHKFLSGNA